MPAFMLKPPPGRCDLDGLEAPSYRPTDNATNNATWPVINLTEATSGELTLAVHDTTDTYRLVVDGWVNPFTSFSSWLRVMSLTLRSNCGTSTRTRVKCWRRTSPSSGRTASNRTAGRKRNALPPTSIPKRL